MRLAVARTMPMCVWHGTCSSKNDANVKYFSVWHGTCSSKNGSTGYILQSPESGHFGRRWRYFEMRVSSLGSGEKRHLRQFSAWNFYTVRCVRERASSASPWNYLKSTNFQYVRAKSYAWLKSNAWKLVNRRIFNSLEQNLTIDLSQDAVRVTVLAVWKVAQYFYRELFFKADLT